MDLYIKHIFIHDFIETQAINQRVLRDITFKDLSTLKSPESVSVNKKITADQRTTMSFRGTTLLTDQIIFEEGGG